MKQETRDKIRLFPRLKGMPLSWWVKIQQSTIRGTPDFIGCVDGCFVALEQKTGPGARIDPLQIFNLEGIRAAGGFGEVIHRENEDEIFRRIREHVNSLRR